MATVTRGASAAAVASRSTMSVGGAVAAALDAVIENGKRLAAHVLEAAEADIQYRGGAFEITGTDRNIALFELAERAKQLGDSLDAKSSFDAAPTFPNGVHVAEVEIDPATGRTTLAAYTCADDCGRVLQPVLVEGQVQGGVAQGVGQALLEWGHYRTMRAASSSPARSWTTRCRAPTIYPISSVCCTRCAARPTRSASRASARLVRQPRSRGDGRGRRCRREHRHARHPRARVAGADCTWRRNLSSVILGQPNGLNPANIEPGTMLLLELLYWFRAFANSAAISLIASARPVQRSLRCFRRAAAPSCRGCSLNDVKGIYRSREVVRQRSASGGALLLRAAFQPAVVAGRWTPREACAQQRRSLGSLS